VTLTDVTVRDNDAAGKGQIGTGGGIAAAGAVTLTRVTVSGNRVATTWDSSFGAFPGQARGGGIRAGSLTATDSTVTGNSANGLEIGTDGGRAVQSTGGGIFADTAVRLTGSQVTGNTLTVANAGTDVVLSRAGGISAASIDLVGTEVTGNVVLDGRTSAPAPDAGALQVEALSANGGSRIIGGPGQRSCTAPPPVPGPSSDTVVGDDTCGLSGPGVVIGG
jgi:hypothetical protein